MKDLSPEMPREMRCKPPNAEIQYKNVRGNIYYFQNVTNIDKKDLNLGKIRPHFSEDSEKTEGRDSIYFIKEELIDFEIEDCEYKDPSVDPGPEVFFDYALLKLHVEIDGHNSVGNIATNIRLVDNDKKEKKERKKRIFLP